jgi:predicted Zn-dependent protease with MMP-like domain
VFLRSWAPGKGEGSRRGGEKALEVSEKEFDRLVKRAIRRIPEEIQQHLDNILISVQRRPSREMLEDMDMDPNEPLLGIYWGVPLTERSVISPPEFSDTIFLFQEPLEEMCDTIEELEEEIEITVVHEIAHAVGISEERLAELGYD